MKETNKELEIQIQALQRLHEAIAQAQAGSTSYLGSPSAIRLTMSWNKDTGAEQCRADCKLVTVLGAFVEAK